MKGLLWKSFVFKHKLSFLNNKVPANLLPYIIKFICGPKLMIRLGLSIECRNMFVIQGNFTDERDQRNELSFLVFSGISTELYRLISFF